MENNKPQTVPNIGPEEMEEDSIDLAEIFYKLLDKWHIILLCIMLGALIANAYSYFMIHPTYQSTASLYVVSASSDSVVNLSDLNLGTSLTADYEILIKGDPVLEKVIDNLDLDMTTEELSECISLSNPTDTRILNITVTTGNAEKSQKIANAIANVTVEYLPETMETNAPHIAIPAKVEPERVGPSYTKNTLIGAIIGLLISCAFIIIAHLRDDTIHNAEEMERYFGIVPLATIPESENLNDGHDEVSSLRKRRHGKKGRAKA